VTATRSTRPRLEITQARSFLTLARRTEALAGGELAGGHTASARSAYLRASTYYDMCLYFVLGTASRAQEANVYAAIEVNAAWQREIVPRLNAVDRYFTAAESAQYHCAPMAPHTRNQVVFDWPDRIL